MQLASRLAEYISACFTGLWVQSHEHEDALTEIAQISQPTIGGWSSGMSIADCRFTARTTPASTQALTIRWPPFVRWMRWDRKTVPRCWSWSTFTAF